MAKRTYTQNNLMAEVYDDGQFRFMETVTLDGIPTIHTFYFNSRNFVAYEKNQEKTTSFSSLDSFLDDDVKNIGTFGPDLYERGVALLNSKGIDVPLEPTGYLKLELLLQDFLSRDEISIFDVKPEMLIGYVSPIYCGKEISLLKVEETQQVLQGEMAVIVKPTDYSKTYLKFTINPDNGFTFVCEYSQFGDDSIIEILKTYTNCGKPKVVAITEKDLKIVKESVPEFVDTSLEIL